MMWPQFMMLCEDYFGRWSRRLVRNSVREYVSTKSGPYLDALWPLIRDSRQVGFGPPDMQALMALKEEAADMMATHPMALLEDNEPKATPAEVRAVLGEVTAKLTAKRVEPIEGITEERRKPLFFPELEGIRPDTPVTLLDEFYDETMTMEERIERYAVRRAQVQAARKEREK